MRLRVFEVGYELEKATTKVHNINALNDDSISKEISNLFLDFPSNQSGNATMYFAYPFVKLCIRDKFSTNNSVGILYNIVDKSYSVQT